MNNLQNERHPLPPFLPNGAKLLMLGSFPPPKKRWSMEFYYPNLNNDMWRIMGLIFYGDKNHFVETAAKTFHKAQIVDFLTERGIALYDTAVVIRRLKDNAADNFLEVVEPADICGLLRQIPDCRAVAVTGQKAMDTLRDQLPVAEPKVSGSAVFVFENHPMRLYRMPSSSRAYPLKLEQKAVVYEKMMREIGIKGVLK
ncbi:uracil-DNA glycosylase family protein [Stenoxybacter acetivorans]|uniref:uracil-DNA glycosylase family protein n=1 Tax=Stenoxybacter acetivorans TaxID=422441 RepID=UPI00056BAEFA|nr:uracil-DNA glycosylase family protein [Stenoxybacter acetivorans]